MGKFKNETMIKIISIIIFVLITTNFVYGSLNSPDSCTKCMTMGASDEYYLKEIKKLDIEFSLKKIDKYTYLIEKGNLNNCMANGFYGSKYFKKAKIIFNKAILIDSINVLAYNSLASLYLQSFYPDSEFVDTSFETLQKAYKLNIQNGETFLLSGEVEFYRKHYGNSIDFLIKAKNYGVCDKTNIVWILMWNYFFFYDFDKAFKTYEESASDNLNVFGNIAATYIIPRDKIIYEKLKSYFNNLPVDSKNLKYRYILKEYEEYIK
jgi:hypothetical protein